MRYAIVNEKFVENVIVADQDFIELHYPEAIECPEIVGVGWTYELGQFIAPPFVEPDDETETI